MHSVQFLFACLLLVFWGFFCFCILVRKLKLPLKRSIQPVAFEIEFSLNFILMEAFQQCDYIMSCWRIWAIKNGVCRMFYESTIPMKNRNYSSDTHIACFIYTE